MKPHTTFDEHLRYEFSEREILGLAKELADANTKADQIDSDKKRVMSDFKSKVDDQHGKIERLSDCISTGYEVKAIRCGTFLNDPEAGRKAIRRLDTNESIRFEDMTSDEMQQPLGLDD